MESKAKNLTYLRAQNQGAILKTLLLEREVSKQDLSQWLNLTPMSISYITNDLLEKGILAEGGQSIKKDSPGRRAVALKLAPNRLLAIGVSISRRHLRISLADLQGNTLRLIAHRHRAEETARSLEERIFDGIEELMTLAPKGHILGIGVSCIGLVDIREKTVFSTTDFFGIKDWPIGKILQERFGLTCYVVEDMKAAGLAEFYYGAAGNRTDFIYLGLTYGLGAGIISNGKLLEGNRGFCGEIGHTTLYHDGKTCGCGNRGCAEMYLSVGAILDRLGLKDWQEFIDLCEKSPNDPAVGSVIRDLSTLLVNTVNCFDTQAVIIGHEGALLSSEIFEQLNQEVNRRIMARRLKSVTILPSAIPHQIHALNGAAIIFSRLFGGEFKL